MKLFNKVLLSTISMFVVANSISYSMDDPIRDSDNNQHYRSYSADYQNNDYNLAEQDKTNINKIIQEILDAMKDYSNKSLIVNTYYLNDCKIKLQNQLIRIKEINSPIVKMLQNRCLISHDSYTKTLSNIRKNDISINHLKDRMKIIEQNLKIQYNNMENEKTDNLSEHNAVKITDNNVIDFLTNIKGISNIEFLTINDSIQNSLDGFKFNQQNNFLSDVIKSAKDYYKVLADNIKQNNILIKEIQEIASDLCNECAALYIKIHSLKENINSCENESKELSNETKKYIEEMENLQNRFYKIANKCNKNIDVDKDKKKYITDLKYIDFEKKIQDKETELKNNNMLKKANKLDTTANNAKGDINVKKTTINSSIHELKNKYKFKSKSYIMDKILYNMRSMLFNTHDISFNNDKLLREKIDKIKLFTDYKNIISLDDKIRSADSSIISDLNTVENHSKYIKLMQENLCDIEGRLGIRFTITKRYEQVQDKNEKLIDKNKNLKSDKAKLISQNKKLINNNEILSSKFGDAYLKNKELFAKLEQNEQQNNTRLLVSPLQLSPISPLQYSANDSNSNSNINSPININIINVKDDDNNKKENEYINRKRKSDRNDKYNK